MFEVRRTERFIQWLDGLSDPRWKAYSAKVTPLLLNQENRILVPTPFSPWATGPAY